MPSFQYACVILLLAMMSPLAASNKKAIVIGASSGMGREIAKRLSSEGYTVGLAARRLDWLESLQAELPNHSFIKVIDVTTPDARDTLTELINDMGGLDLMVISISAYLDNRDVPTKAWAEKERTLNVDAKGFIAMADLAFDYFMAQNHGHLVGISSTSGLRGFASSPHYSGAKACISYYMEGMRCLMKRENIDVQVTNVIPGFVAVEHSPLGEDPDAYWEIPVEEAGQCIMDGIRAKKNVVYVPSKAWLISLLKYIPDWAYYRYFNWM